MIGSKYLTDLSHEQMLTHPGQAHFAIPDEKRTCDGCWFWMPERARDRSAICAKARETMSLERLRKVPRYATICKHFKTRDAR
jgi:hypothetical protein